MKEAQLKLNKTATKLIEHVKKMNNTMIYFFSDHGTTEQGEHGGFSKVSHIINFKL